MGLGGSGWRGGEAGYPLETHMHLMPIQNHYLFIQGEFSFCYLSFPFFFFTDVKVDIILDLGLAPLPLTVYIQHHDTVTGAHCPSLCQNQQNLLDVGRLR